MIDDLPARKPWYRAHVAAVLGGSLLLAVIATSAIVLFSADRGRATALSTGADVRAPQPGRLATTTAPATTSSPQTHPAAESTAAPTTTALPDSVLASGLGLTDAAGSVASAPPPTAPATPAPSRDVTAPVIVITEPPEGTHVAHANIVLRGIAEGGSRIESTDGRRTTAGPKGYWQLDVPLTAGRNDVVVTATDAAGNIGKATIIVFYDGTWPGLAPSTDLGPTPVGSTVAPPPQSGPVTASVPLDPTAAPVHANAPAVTTASRGGS